jgi:hypothetical protein
LKRIEGYISKKAVRYWLENYEYLEAGDRPPDAPPSNSGPKSPDGVSANQLNKIMLDQAIENLPPLHKACVKARWVYKFRMSHTLRTLEIGSSVYKQRTNEAITLIHDELNGDKVGYMGLLSEILK